jgi:hypothetical protein
MMKPLGRAAAVAGCLLLFGTFVQARPAPIEAAGVLLDGQLGVSQDGHGYVRPRIRYTFGAGSWRLFAETIYEHRLNERLEGSVDYWLRAGALAPLGRAFSLELSVNHLCRHALSLPGTFVLSVNEALGRLWWASEGVRLGLGLGTYLRTSRVIFDEPDGGHGLAVADLAWEDILGSPLSLSAELKLADFEKLMPDVELRARLGWGVFLFLRNVTTYGLPNMTYFGLGYGSRPSDRTSLSFVVSEAAVLPWDETHKLAVDQAAQFDLARTPDNRFLLEVEADVPVLRGAKFIGLFRPERMKYPLGLEYERRLGEGTFLFGYAAYEISVPVDVARKFSTALGLGLGLRNQRVFTVLTKPLRYEVSAGLNSPHDYDVRLSLGVNTVGGKPDFGLEAAARLNADARQAAASAFVEFGREIRVRLIAGVDWLRDLVPAPTDVTRFRFGFAFFRLFEPNA